MAYDVTQNATIGHLKALALRAKNAIDAAIQALPNEMFLDQANTVFVPSFTFNSTTYAGATDPNLNGKPVLVLAVKGIDHKNNNAETITYSFLDVSTLVDISSKADKVANPTAGHVAGLDANGNPTDTGIAATEVLTAADVATDAECTEMLNEVFGAA